MSTVLFHRNFRQFQGGHLKVFHYFEHVRSSPAHEALIRFTENSVWDASNPWWGMPDAVIGDADVKRAEVLFLAGMDWQWLEPEQRIAPRLPVVNLIQGRHAARDTAVRRFLAHPAIRICVGTEIQEELEAFGVQGPMFTVPIAIDLERLPPARPAEERDIDCVLLALKDPELGRAIAKRLAAAGYQVMLVDRSVPREELLEAMARARITVHLPLRREGAYMPALESMALGALVVCPDCIGNRSFCRDGETAVVPDRNEKAIVESALSVLKAPIGDLRPMLAAARAESRARALNGERTQFLQILDRVQELWGAR